MVMVTACSLLLQGLVLLGYLKPSSYKLIPSFLMKGSIKVEGGEECAICLCGMGDDEEELISHLGCKHVFHKSCLDRWVEHRGQTCPLCRSHFEAAELDCNNGRKITSIVFCPFGDSAGISDTDSWWIR